MTISRNEQEILRLLLTHNSLRSSQAHRLLAKENGERSLVTVKRTLAAMLDRGLVTRDGAGPSTTYQATAAGRVWCDINAREYCTLEPDRRFGMKRFNFDLFPNMPRKILTGNEKEHLESATNTYRKRNGNIPTTVAKKELERLIIELSWKSSKIEGNTYTLLDTERLIKEDRAAPGHSREEARMILNHKEAFLWINGHRKECAVFSRTTLEHIHGILTKNLRVRKGLRSGPVGVLGSTYQPLDNIHHIREAVDTLSSAINRMSTTYEKALLALLGISYIQPFEDGNKRTGRLMANALLLANGKVPLSYRSVDENEYREATLVFYETNSIAPFKKIFIEQYDFSANNYLVS